jgi:hypothetical protein
MARGRSAGRQMLVAKESFATQDENGVPVSVIAGVTRVEEGHWLLDGGREAFFQPMDAHFANAEAAVSEPPESVRAAVAEPAEPVRESVKTADPVREYVKAPSESAKK